MARSVQRAESELDLKTLGPSWPSTHLTPGEWIARLGSLPLLDQPGWGLMMSVPAADGSTGVPGGYGWDGGTGTTWRTDTAAGLTGILLTQRMVTSPEPTEIVTDFWAAAYAAIDA